MPANEVAAIIVEPIQGEGGYVVPEPGFLAGLRAICDEHGIVLIADEIQSGAGRSGRMWAVEHEGVEPDILLTAKGIGSGMPIAAMIARAELLEAWGPARTARPTAATRSRALRRSPPSTCCEDGLVENAAIQGERAMVALDALAARHPGVIRDIRGKGLMIGIELDTPDRAERVEWGCFERGLLVLQAGKSCVRLSPPLIVTADESTPRCASSRRPSPRPSESRCTAVGGGRRPHVAIGQICTPGSWAALTATDPRARSAIPVGSLLTGTSCALRSAGPRWPVPPAPPMHG